MNADAVVSGNTYTYCVNNPTAFVDSDGFSPTSALFSQVCCTDLYILGCLDCVQLPSGMVLKNRRYYRITPVEAKGYATPTEMGNDEEPDCPLVKVYKHNTVDGSHEFYVAQYNDGKYTFYCRDYIVVASAEDYIAIKEVEIYEYELGVKDLQKGEHAPTQYVRHLQRHLQSHGVYSGEITGEFDDLTDAAVRKLQRRFRLPVDGIAGPATKPVVCTPVEP